MQVSSEQARKLARLYKEFADRVRLEGDPVGANYADWQSQWWLARADTIDEEATKRLC
jgi:hypothetical protein